MVRHKEQRVGVFVDVQNMYYSAKQLYSAKVNFSAILKEAVAGRRLIRAIAYAIHADIKEESHFHDALTNIGYEVRLKDLQIFLGGAKKGDWDIGLAMDIVRMSSKLDVVVLVSGDGDFKEMLEYIKANGCRAEVIAFSKTTSSKLKEESDVFIDMGKDLRKYLIGKRIVSQKMPPKKVIQKPVDKPINKPVARPVDKPVARPSKDIQKKVIKKVLKKVKPQELPNLKL